MRSIRIIMLFFFIAQLANAQAPFQVNLSQKHINKIEEVKSAKDKLRLYRKYYRQDSLKQAKEYEKLLRKKYDSLAAVYTPHEFGLLDSVSVDSLVASQLREFKPDSAELWDRLMDETPEAERLIGARDGIGQWQKQSGSFSVDSLKDIFGSQVKNEVARKINSLEEINSIKTIKQQQESFDPWANDHVDVTRFRDSVYLKELALKQAEEMALKHLSEHPELLDPIQKKMDWLMKKYRVVPNSNDLSTAIKRSSLQGRPFRERLYLAANFQILSVEPFSIDLAPMIGYKFNTKFVAGIGGLYRQTFGEPQLTLAPEVFGYKAFLSYDLFKSIFVYTEYANNSPGVRQTETGTERIWIDAWLVGAGRKFPVHRKIDMTILLLYNVLKEINDPVYPGRWNFRVGFQVSELGLRKIKR